MRIRVKVIPNSKKNEIKGFKEGILYIKISAPPIKGKANEELVDFLQKKFGVKGIKIVTGEKSRLKMLDIPLSEEEFLRLIHF